MRYASRSNDGAMPEGFTKYLSHGKEVELRNTKAGEAAGYMLDKLLQHGTSV